MKIDPPVHRSIGTVTLGTWQYAHHDDAWRDEINAFSWDLPDIGDAVFFTKFSTEFPHETDEGRNVIEQTEIIIPLEVLRDVVAHYDKGGSNGS